MGGFNSAPLPGGGGDSALPAGPSSSGSSFPTAGGSSFPTAGGSSFSNFGDSSLPGLSSNDFGLSAPVGPGAVNAPDDVFRVESVLSDADFLGRAPGRSFGDDTFSAIKTAQARLNDDPRVDVGRRPLKLDGLVNPDGPTQAATRVLAGDVIARRAASVPKPQPPKPAVAMPGAPRPLATPAEPSRLVATPSGPRRETLAQTVKRFASKGPLKVPKPAMTGDQAAALERLVGGLRKVTHPGPIAKDIAGAFRADGPGTVAEFKVVRDSLAKSGTPEQVENLTEGVRAELNAEDRGRFDKLLAGTDGGVKMTPPRKPIPPGRDDPKGGFKSPIAKEFRDQLHELESPDGPNKGYGAHNPEGGGIGALGRYQMREDALKDAGLIDKPGRWTGKHGINSAEDFRANPKAQEQAFADFMRVKRDQLERKGAFKEAGRTFNGLKGEPITITESGLLAAGHRMGQDGVKEYLKHMRGRGWRSDFSGLEPEVAARHKAVETRLREFQNTPIRRTR